jgi:ribose transport system permease protein
MAFVLPAACWVVFAIVTKGRFATAAMFLSIIRTSVVPVLVAMSMSFGMLMGLWNFSAGAIVYASAIFATHISNLLGLGVPGICVLSILIGVLLCGIMGGLYRLLRIPCLVLSLGLVIIYEALPGIFLPNATAKISLMSSYLGRAPWCYVIAGVMLVIFVYINSCTVLGADIRAIGADVRIARNAGIKIDRVKFVSFIISGIFLGVAGIIFVSTNITVTGVIGLATAGLIFDGIMGIFIAFVLTKYINYGVAVVIGTLTIRMLSSGLIACGLSSEVRGTLTGAFLFVVVAYSANAGLFDRLKSRKLTAKKANAAYTNTNKE